MTHILVLANSLVPLPGLPTSGGGLRAWTLAQGLEAAGYTVTLLFPRHSLNEQLIPIPADAYAAALSQTFAWEAVDQTIAQVAPDIVLASSWVLAGQIQHCPVPLVVDLAGPLLLEFLAQDWQKGAALAHLKTKAIAQADYVICAGERQRPYFQPWLLLSGFSPADCQERLAVVPISCAPQFTPHPPPNPEPLFLYTGMIYAWQDPSQAIATTIAVLERRDQGQLRIQAQPHPIHSQGATWFAQLQARFGDHPRVSFGPVLPYTELSQVYREADLALDLFARTVERELAFNTRTVDFLHAGLPPLYGDYAELSPLLREYGAGFVVDPEDTAAITAAIEQVFDQPMVVARMSAGAQRLASERLTWDRTITPLATFCAAPTRRTTGPLSPLTLVPELVTQLAQLQVELHNTQIAADERQAYAQQVEQAWHEQGRQLATQEQQLANWRQQPWRSAANQTLSGLRTRLHQRQRHKPEA